jgi:hypothetical protein
MMIRFLYDSRGKPVGFIHDRFIYSMRGRPVGQLSGTHVHKMSGSYVGELHEDMVVNKRLGNFGNIGRAGNPSNIGIPGKPGNRGVVNYGYPDVFTKLLED